MTVGPICTTCRHRGSLGDEYCRRCGQALEPPSGTDFNPGNGFGADSSADSWIDRNDRAQVGLLRAVSVQSDGGDDADPRSRKPVSLRFDPVVVVLAVMAAGMMAVAAWRAYDHSRVRVEGLAGPLVSVATWPAATSPGVVDLPGMVVDVQEDFDAVDAEPGNGPVTSRPTGLSVLVGNADKWTLLDLDTGKWRSLEPRGRPVLATEGHLVVERGTSLWSIPMGELADPEGAEVRLENPIGGSGVWAIAEPVGDNQVVIVSERRNEVRSARVDLVTGRAREEPVAAGPDSFSLALGGLRFAPGAGTFDRAADGSWRRVSDGYPLVAAPSAVLIELCTAADECSQFWVDRATGERLDRTVADALIGLRSDGSPLPAPAYPRPLDHDGQVILGWLFGDPSSNTIFIVDEENNRALTLNNSNPWLPADDSILFPRWPSSRDHLLLLGDEDGLNLVDLDRDLIHHIADERFLDGGQEPGMTWLLVTT